MADGSGRPGQPEEQRRDPGAPPQEGVSLGKEQPQGPGDAEHPGKAVADQPTIAGDIGPPASHKPGSPTAPPPPAPPPSPYGYGTTAPHAQPGPPPGTQGAAPHASGYGYPSPSPVAPPTPYGYGFGYGWAQPLPAGKSIAAMVLGIVTMVLLCTCWGSFLGLVTGPVALCLGLSARRQADRGELGGRGQAVAGFVMGIVGTVLSVLIVVGLVVAIVMAAKDDKGPGSDPYGDGSSLDALPAAAPLSPGA